VWNLGHVWCILSAHAAPFVTLCSADNELYLDGRDFKDASNLTELILDGSRFCTDNLASYIAADDSCHYLLMQCPRLECLSIRNLEWDDMEVTQEDIMKLV